MESQASQMTLGLLPDPRARWQKFVFSYGVQSILVTFALVAAIMNPDILEIPMRDYRPRVDLERGEQLPDGQRPGELVRFAIQLDGHESSLILAHAVRLKNPATGPRAA